MIPRRVRYAINRLRSLRPRELLGKLTLWYRHAVDRIVLRVAPGFAWWERGTVGLDSITSARNAGADLEGCDRALCNAIPHPWWNDGSFWKVFSQRYPSESELILRRAEEVIDGSFLLFQWKSVSRNASSTWSETMEPDAPSAQWPNDYHSSIEVLHDPLRSQRDIKWCWELNRFQHLLWLGAAWRLTGEERFARAAREQLESWLAEVRYPFGVHWNSNLEVALRALSWARCHILCRDSSAWSPDFLRVFLPSLHIHGLHVERELTIHHRQSNHILGEAAALVLLGHLYPGFSSAKRWTDRGGAILSDVVPCLVLPDGVYGEQSTGYLRFVAEFLLEVIQCVGSAGSAFISGSVRERLLRTLEFVSIIAHDPADVPMIGDSDTGRAIGWQISDFWDFRWLLAAGAVLLDSPELAARVDEFPAEAYLLLGDGGEVRFHSLREQAHEQRECDRSTRVHSFPCGGYQVSSDRTFHLIFDTGPLGLGPAYSHGHCDALSFVLSYEGLPLFIDPGTYTYNGLPEWRNYFRSTSAHNTIRIDDRDPSVPLGPFRWIQAFTTSAGPHCCVGQWRCFRALLDWPQAQHERFILHLEGRLVLIVDHLLGTGPHHAEWNFHLAPSWEVNELPNGGWSLDRDNKRVEMFRESSFAVDTHMLDGSESPKGGWYSRSYGQRMSSTNLRWTCRTEFPAVSVIAIKPGAHNIGADVLVPACGLPEEAVRLIESPRFRSFLGNSL